MALTELDRKRVEKLVAAYVAKRRPPPHLRPQVDLAFRVSGQSVEIFEIRPRWDRPDEKQEHAIAKATYVKTQDIWKVFWMRADLKWHRYDPMPTVDSVAKFLQLVENDEYSCFFG